MPETWICCHAKCSLLDKSYPGIDYHQMMNIGTQMAYKSETNVTDSMKSVNHCFREYPTTLNNINQSYRISK